MANPAETRLCKFTNPNETIRTGSTRPIVMRPGVLYDLEKQACIVGVGVKFTSSDYPTVDKSQCLKTRETRKCPLGRRI